MIAVTDLAKNFGERRVLQGLTLVVQPGVVTLLVGANGAGKTTLLRIITGLCEADAGSVLVRGVDVARRRLEVLGRLAFLPQAPRFHPRLTVRQVARYYGRLRGRSNEDVHQELERWGLTEHLHATTTQLSGGLRQRLALAIFALARAEVNILDEPGLSLDPEWRVNLQKHLSARAASGATVLVATHLLGEWEGKVDECVVLDKGRAGGVLPPGQLREAFANVERKTAR